MACDLTKGRKEPCKDSVGGIKAVYFADFGDITIAYDSTDTDVVDDLGTVTVFKYELKGNSSFEQTITSSRENGTTTIGAYNGEGGAGSATNSAWAANSVDAEGFSISATTPTSPDQFFIGLGGDHFFSDSEL